MESADTEADADGWEEGSQSLLVSASYLRTELIFAYKMQELKV
jgi:hypothetical protein